MFELKHTDPKKEAYGQELWAYFKGKESSETIERENGHLDVSSGPKTYFSEYRDWPEHEKKAIRLVSGRVLDIGCGAGRHSLYLQKKGFEVMGIDSSPLAIKICKLKGLRKAKVIPINEIGKFKPDSFDTVIMLGHNFGLFGSLKRAKLLLKKLYKITSPRGTILAETRDPYKTKDTSHLEYHKLNKRRGRMAGQIKLRVRFGKYVGGWFDYLIVSKEEMKKIVNGTGWKIEKVIGSKTPSYIAVLGK